MRKTSNKTDRPKKKKSFDQMLKDANRTRASSRHLEDKLQIECVSWFDENHPLLKWKLWHIPNGGARKNGKEGRKFKLMGVRAGAPDLQLSISRNGHPYLAIEMKTLEKDSDLTDNQVRMKAELEEEGILYVVCRTKDQFIETITKYLSGEL